MAFDLSIEGNYIYVTADGVTVLDRPSSEITIVKKNATSTEYSVYHNGNCEHGFSLIDWTDFTLDGAPFASQQDFEDWKNANTGIGAQAPDSGGVTPGGAIEPNLIEVAVDGSTTGGVYKSMSLLFRGNGGSLDGVDVPNNFSASYNAEGATLDPIPYTVPTGGQQRIIISFTS